MNLSTANIQVIRQCTDYLKSRRESREKWEKTSNERNLLNVLKRVKSSSQEYNEDTEYLHVVYHTILP